MARNCHRAVYHGAALRGGLISYLMPAATRWGIPGAIDPAAVAAALKREENIGLIVVTSPTYEGVVSDVAAIAGIAHRHRVPLLVDAAHGAHFGFSEDFPQNAVEAGADLVVHSLHKTMLSLTQTGLLHLNGGPCRWNGNAAACRIPDQQPLLSADGQHRRLHRQDGGGGAGAVAYGRRRLAAFYRRMEKLRSLAVLGVGEGGGMGIGRDPGRIVILTAGGGWSGREFLSLLRRRARHRAGNGHGRICRRHHEPLRRRRAFRRLGDALLALDQKRRRRSQTASL